MYFCSICNKTYDDIHEAMKCCVDKLQWLEIRNEMEDKLKEISSNYLPDGLKKEAQKLFEDQKRILDCIESLFFESNK